MLDDTQKIYLDDTGIEMMLDFRIADKAFLREKYNIIPKGAKVTIIDDLDRNRTYEVYAKYGEGKGVYIRVPAELLSNEEIE